MEILLAADIFGETRHLKEIAAACRQTGNSCRTVGPFPPSICYDDERRAYAAFMQHGGVDSYTGKVMGRLAEFGDGSPVCIGFSAGAAALWQALSDPAAECVRLAVCFYGGQIRNAVAVEPRCPSLLVFPEREAHFSVEELMVRLRGRENVSCASVPWRHGYMNRLSAHFNREGFERTMGWLGWLLSRQDPAAGWRSALRHLPGAAL